MPLLLHALVFLKGPIPELTILRNPPITEFFEMRVIEYSGQFCRRIWEEDTRGRSIVHMLRVLTSLSRNGTQNTALKSPNIKRFLMDTHACILLNVALDVLKPRAQSVLLRDRRIAAQMSNLTLEACSHVWIFHNLTLLLHRVEKMPHLVLRVSIIFVHTSIRRHLNVHVCFDDLDRKFA